MPLQCYLSATSLRYYLSATSVLPQRYLTATSALPHTFFGYSSDSLQTLSRLQFELRSFAQGARDALESLQQFVYNRALLDSKLAVQTAEYLLRRAIFDSGRILSAASSNFSAASSAYATVASLASLHAASSASRVSMAESMDLRVFLMDLAWCMFTNNIQQAYIFSGPKKNFATLHA